MTVSPDQSAAPDTPGRAALRREAALCRQWLFEAALPFWATSGTDQAGGFFERFHPDGTPTDEPRRARVVGRQIYSFAMAERMGWTGPARAIQDHGLAFLRRGLIGPDGMVVATCTPAGVSIDSRFDLYDHAFVLFGLAGAASVRGDGLALSAFAEELLRRMMARWKHPAAGFEESHPRSLPLKANPHMHILEASLAWTEVSSSPVGGAPVWGARVWGARVWEALADEIAELCLRCFLDPATGALREYFDADWLFVGDHAGSVVEPGHQLEWAWLLFRWGRLRDRADAVAAARRLIEIADRYGTDPARDLVINELNADLTLRDPLARLWPQTERIKAFVTLGRMAETAAEADAAFAAAARAAAGLRRYWVHPIRGCWWEHIGIDGKPLIEATRASSLYHIVCAISEMGRAEDAI